ncbi:type II toxin-antitoxin system PemK/MazF family toxin [Dehalococcoidia bacterium]|nr:type II toxin-antitoxin system PemK/MazF family toxin [Dehalococcoidia bacterium]MCL0092365.1 type II toxin-antitoxin system PemK/MazF family toxin [Dehalococcoidia bacterium]
MTEYSRGDVVLVTFVFTDETGVRRRPAVIISSDTYHQGREETIIAAITSRIDRVLVGDHLIRGWREAGLLFPSVATSIIRTIKRAMIIQKLGAMPGADMEAIDSSLRLSLRL